MVYYGHKGVAITSHGESATSEGFVYEAINGASLERLPVIFVIQDNGYGISVPKSEQTANRKVAENFSGFKNLKIIYCNGKDVFDSMNAMTSILSLLMKLLSLRAVATGTTVAFGRDYFSMIGVLRMMPFKLHGSIFIKS